MMASTTRTQMINDDEIAKKIKEMDVPADKVGKRLRHEIMKTMILPDKSSKNYYQMLKYYDCEDMPDSELKVIKEHITAIKYNK